MKSAVASLLLACVLVAPVAQAAKPAKAQKMGEAWVYTLEGKSYANVRDDLVMAIEERGMVISAVSHVKDMIDRTSADLGFKQGIYDTGGETLMFCKADLSQAMMRDNVHNIAFCPYGISVYTLRETPGKVYLSYRDPPKMAVYKPIHQLLDSIIQQVAE